MPILSYPSTDDMFIQDTDASEYGVGAVFSQLQDGKEVVIATQDPKWDIVQPIGSCWRL